MLEYIFDMYILSVMRFEWDEEKALENAKKHRVSFEQAQQVFDDPRAVPFEDLEHSTTDENSVCNDRDVFSWAPVRVVHVS